MTIDRGKVRVKQKESESRLRVWIEVASAIQHIPESLLPTLAVQVAPATTKRPTLQTKLRPIRLGDRPITGLDTKVDSLKLNTG